jgi:phospholipase/carboxylesterase
VTIPASASSLLPLASLAVLLAASLSCRASSGSKPRAGIDSGRWGGLETEVVTSMPGGEAGGRAVVVLHGWGAAGDDMVPVARALLAPHTRYFVPAAPLPHAAGGRAWWPLERADRPVLATGDEPAGVPELPPEALAARAAVKALLEEIRARVRPERLSVVGFSQGGMLALEAALAGDPPVDRVAVLSGALLARSIPRLRALERKPAVFVSHGRSDPVLPFAAGERIRSLLVEAGFAVTWRPFAGGHTIPAELLGDLAAFLAE